MYQILLALLNGERAACPELRLLAANVSDNDVVHLMKKTVKMLFQVDSNVVLFTIRAVELKFSETIIVPLQFVPQLLRVELEQLATAHPDKFAVHFCVDALSSPEINWPYTIGRLSPEMCAAQLPAPAEDTLIFVCGPPGGVVYSLQCLELLPACSRFVPPCSSGRLHEGGAEASRFARTWPPVHCAVRMELTSTTNNLINSVWYCNLQMRRRCGDWLPSAATIQLKRHVTSAKLDCNTTGHQKG